MCCFEPLHVCSLVTAATANSYKGEQGSLAFTLILKQLGMSHQKDKRIKQMWQSGNPGEEHLAIFCIVFATFL